MLAVDTQWCEGFRMFNKNLEGLNPHCITSAYHNDVYVQGEPMPTNYSNELTTLTLSMLTLDFEERPTAN